MKNLLDFFFSQMLVQPTYFGSTSLFLFICLVSNPKVDLQGGKVCSVI